MSGEWKKDWDRKGIEEKKRHESEGGGVEREWKNEREREREREREKEREREREREREKKERSMKACFWWDSKSQHLFGWGSEKSSVSPCSARGNAIPGCMGFYEKQLYVEKGRRREPEKERQQGKEGEHGGRRKRGRSGERKGVTYGGRDEIMKSGV